MPSPAKALQSTTVAAAADPLEPPSTRHTAVMRTPNGAIGSLSLIRG
jgi:hypothetical protein